MQASGTHRSPRRSIEHIISPDLPQAPNTNQLPANNNTLSTLPIPHNHTLYHQLQKQYRGFTPAIIDLKNKIHRSHPELPTEASGSKWPKCSIGCVQDGQTLTEEQFNALNALCKRFSEAFNTNGENNSTTTVNSDLKIAVDSAAIIIYGCRSLQKIISCHLIPFRDDQTDTREASPEEAERVRLIVSEADDPDYYKAVARDGNRRSHYSAPNVGVTLAHPLPLSFLKIDSPRSVHTTRSGLRQRGVQEVADRTQLLKLIYEFKQEVVDLLPGMYYWFDEGSLHITLRALIL